MQGVGALFVNRLVNILVLLFPPINFIYTVLHFVLIVIISELG